MPARSSRPSRRPKATWTNQITAVIGMTLIWNLLWGQFSVGNLVAGFLLSMLVLAFFPLPPVEIHGRLRPLAALWFLAHFLGDLVLASIHVSWAAIRPSRRLSNAIIAVPLRVRTDLNLTLVAEALSLLPGSIIIEVRRSGTLYVHILDVGSAADAGHARSDITRLEARIVRAIGTADEVRQLSAGPPPGTDERTENVP